MDLHEDIKNDIMYALSSAECIVDHTIDISCSCKTTIFVNRTISKYELNIQFIFSEENEDSLKEKVIFDTEEKVMSLIHFTNSSIVRRSISPVRELGLTTISYKISFKDLDNFCRKIKQYSRYKIDSDFDKILSTVLTQY